MGNYIDKNTEGQTGPSYQAHIHIPKKTNVWNTPALLSCVHLESHSLADNITHILFILITKPRVETESYATTVCYGSWTAKTVKLNDGLNHVRRHTKSTQTFITNRVLRSSVRCFAGMLSGYWHCLIVHKVDTISGFLVLHKKKVSEPRYTGKCKRQTVTTI